MLGSGDDVTDIGDEAASPLSRSPHVLYPDHQLETDLPNHPAIATEV